MTDALNTPKRGRGRPKVEGSRTDGPSIYVRTTQDQHDVISSAAEALGVTASRFVLDRALESLGEPTGLDDDLGAARARIALLETELGRLIASLRGCADAADVIAARTGVK